MTKLPIGITPRALSREQAAKCCGCDSASAFDDGVREGFVPRAMRGTIRRDRKAIDRPLDRHPGLLIDNGPSMDEWVAKHGE